MQSSNDEIQILEHEIQRVRSRSAIEDFDVKELQVKAVLARDNAEQTEAVRKKLKRLER